MKLIQGNDWILLNDIIYKIHSNENFIKMRKDFLELIRLLIPYDAATFYLAGHEEGHLLSNPVGINTDDEKLQKYIDVYENIDYAKWVIICAKSMVYRETDLLTDSVREATPYYREVYVPENIHYSAQVSLVYNGIFYGIISFYRSKDCDDFSESELFILDTVKDHLALVLFKESSEYDIKNEQLQPELNWVAYAEQYKLTSRETEIFKLLFEGISSDTICQQLYISIHTLKKHTLNIYKKLGVKNRLQLFHLIHSPSL